MVDIVRTISLEISESELITQQIQFTSTLNSIAECSDSEKALTYIREARSILIAQLKSLQDYEDDLFAQQAPEAEYIGQGGEHD